MSLSKKMTKAIKEWTDAICKEADTPAALKLAQPLMAGDIPYTIQENTTTVDVCGDLSFCAMHMEMFTASDLLGKWASTASLEEARELKKIVGHIIATEKSVNDFVASDLLTSVALEIGQYIQYVSFLIILRNRLGNHSLIANEARRLIIVWYRNSQTQELVMTQEGLETPLSYLLLNTVMVWGHQHGIVKLVDNPTELTLGNLRQCNTEVVPQQLAEAYYLNRTGKLTCQQFYKKVHYAVLQKCVIPRMTYTLGAIVIRFIREYLYRVFLKDNSKADYSERLRQAEATLTSLCLWNTVDEYEQLKLKLEQADKVIVAKDSKIKIAEQKLAETQQRLTDTSKLLSQTKSELQSLLDSGMQDTTALRERITILEAELEVLRDIERRLNKNVLSLESDLSKKDVEIESITSKLELATSQRDSLLSEQSYRTQETVETATLCKLLREYRIAIFGGNLLHNHINALGLPQLRVFEANYVINPVELKSYDVYVIMTAQTSHANSNQLKVLQKKSGVPLIHYNGKSTDSLIRFLFNYFYADSN